MEKSPNNLLHAWEQKSKCNKTLHLIPHIFFQKMQYPVSDASIVQILFIQLIFQTKPKNEKVLIYFLELFDSKIPKGHFTAPSL